MMVKAGLAVDDLVASLTPLLEKGDILIDGGNAHFLDTIRREKELKASGLRYLGVGISGGEEGALNGPSIMPGGDYDAHQEVSPIFAKIAAFVEKPCTTYIGPDGAGHFVKMVHNGIEYGDMQLIAESYHLLTHLGGFTPPALGELFSEWNEGVLNSFLIEITSTIFKRKDDLGDGFLVDKILDMAEQKGTGRWTVQAALDLGVPIPTLTAAVDARALSALKKERVHASKLLQALAPKRVVNDTQKDLLAKIIHDALYAAKILSYTQGMALLKAASNNWSWNLNLAQVAEIWRGGCIIRARFLNDIATSYREEPLLPSLMLAQFMRAELERCVTSLREVVTLATTNGIPVPALAASLSYLDSYRSSVLPQNLTQAQRDLFGAHTYRRIDKGDEVFHSEWSIIKESS
jgi:6-phosphogluconate dehydrogenase